MAMWPCRHARSQIAKHELTCNSENLPYGCPTEYYPRDKILEVFSEDDCLQKVFHCECENCRSDKNIEQVTDSSPYFDESELLGKYATIYALLIWHYRPGLIRLFRRSGVFLSGSNFLSEAHLAFLQQDTVADTETITKEILRNQYKFNIKTLEPVTEPLSIDCKEVLPINENTTPKGRGGFGVVYTFQIQEDEYRGQEFKDKGVRSL
jgi:hypothetical protein